MPKLQPAVGQHGVLPKEGLANLLRTLRQDGYTVIGPTVERDVIVLQPISSTEQLARGLRDQQQPGVYRLKPADPDLFFQYVVGPHGPKRYLFPPIQQLFALHVRQSDFVFDSGPPQPPKLAFVGLRPCELAAMASMDRVFAGQSRCESDVYYLQARKQMFIVAVNCTHPAGTCFCASMNTGPQAREGFDLALTEMRGAFLVRVGSARGAQVAASLELQTPTAAEIELAELKLEQAREHMGRKLDRDEARHLLEQNIEHPHWDEVAKRCLACGNCTMVCPTCFCSSVSDANDLTGGGVSRTRLWESCYTHQFSYTTAGPVRSTIRARYRHWLRHKLCTMWDQFGVSGCVGCGRCITWCPVGIDLTQEIVALRGGSPIQPAELSPNVESEV